MDGIIIIDKPQDYTSFDVVAVMRGLCKQKKVGHTGTLDPMATGVLPILLGKATRCAPFLEDTDKEYEARFRLGVSTDTQDSTGQVIKTRERKVSREELEAMLPRFRGEIQQIPPMYSAVQKDGCRLYTLARQGIEVERESRPVTIFRCDLLSFDEDAQEGALLVTCSKGTYIRTLCADLGEALGSYGIMTGLRRTVACGFSLSDALPLEAARERVAQGGGLEDRLLPIADIFGDKASVTVSEAQAIRFRNGGALSLDRTSLRGTQEDGRIYRIFGPAQQFLGLGHADTGRRIIENFTLVLLRIKSMKVITNFSTYVPSEQGISVAIGCFDGLHRAHQAVIGRTVADRSQGLIPSVFTFHTDCAGLKGAPMLTTNEQRLSSIETMGVEQVFFPPWKKSKI